MDAGPQKSGRKISGLHNPKIEIEPSTLEKSIITPEAATQVRERKGVKPRHTVVLYHERDMDHRTRNCPIFLESKKKMTQKQNQPLNPPPAKEVNHTTHRQQPSQSSSSY
jgi:hypothetical protein